MKVRSPRPGNEKRCPRCEAVFDVSQFAHNSSRPDHREQYCRPCKREVQRTQKRRHARGKAQALSAFSPVGETTTVIIGTFVSQGVLSAYEHLDSRLEPTLVQYKVVGERNSLLYELVLAPTQRPLGTDADHIKIAHPFKALFDAPLQVGDALAVVYQDGEPEKILRAGDPWPIIDTSDQVEVDEESELGLRFTSYLPARPWMLGLAIEFILGGDEPKQTGCPLCGNEQGKVEDFTLRCPSCTTGLRYSAELLLMQAGAVGGGPSCRTSGRRSLLLGR